MRPAILLVAVVTVVAAACAPPEPAVDVATETESLREAAAAYIAAGEAMDAVAMAALYADDAQSFPPNEGTLVGPAAFQAFVEGVAEIEGFSIAFDDPEVVVGAGGDLGYTVGTVQLTMPGPDGELGTMEERDVHIWRKQADGSWKVVVDIWNTATPPATPEEGEPDG